MLADLGAVAHETRRCRSRHSKRSTHSSIALGAVAHEIMTRSLASLEDVTTLAHWSRRRRSRKKLKRSIAALRCSLLDQSFGRAMHVTAATSIEKKTEDVDRRSPLLAARSFLRQSDVRDGNDEHRARRQEDGVVALAFDILEDEEAEE